MLQCKIPITPKLHSQSLYIPCLLANILPLRLVIWMLWIYYLHNLRTGRQHKYEIAIYIYLSRDLPIYAT